MVINGTERNTATVVLASLLRWVLELKGRQGAPVDWTGAEVEVSQSTVLSLSQACLFSALYDSLLIQPNLI